VHEIVNELSFEAKLLRVGDVLPRAAAAGAKSGRCI
jgi:hypothetical protein